jgi:hypothetical protein
MSVVTFRTLGSCDCPRDNLAVTVNLDPPGGDVEGCEVSVTCVACQEPVWMEKRSCVVAEDVPMLLTRTVEGAEVVYTLTPEGGGES